MKSMHGDRVLFVSAGLLAALALAVPPAWAQARKATPAQPAAAARERVVIKKIEGLGSLGRIRTPEYNVNLSESPPVARDWARVLVQFETAAEWIDELEFRYFVQVKNKNNQMLRFLGTVVYVDIPKGKQHMASVFLRPDTLERYGEVFGVAVEVYSKGEQVAVYANPEGPQGWWRGPATKEVAGVLLQRSQTPFAFVAYDAYVTEKPR